MSLLDWATLGLTLISLLVLIRLGVVVGRNYAKTEGALISQQLMVTALLTRVYMLERIVEQAGLVKFGADDDEPVQVMTTPEQRAEFEKLFKEDAG